MKPVRPRLTWAGLCWFWAIVLLTPAIGAAALHWLGPPRKTAVVAAIRPVPISAAEKPGAPVVKIRRDRIGLIVAGIGLSQADSLAAARLLPTGATLAISPYATDADAILEIARARKLELLLMLALEPANFPLTDMGKQALVATASDDENLPRLRWMLSRVSGYAGVISVEPEAPALRLDAIAALLTLALPPATASAAPMIRVHTGRGRLPDVWSRSVDLVLDMPYAGAAIGLRLDELARLARGADGAVGMATVPRTSTIELIAAWAGGLRDRGLVLTPMSEMAFGPTEKAASHD